MNLTLGVLICPCWCNGSCRSPAQSQMFISIKKTSPNNPISNTLLNLFTDLLFDPGLPCFINTHSNLSNFPGTFSSLLFKSQNPFCIPSSLDRVHYAPTIRSLLWVFHGATSILTWVSLHQLLNKKRAQRIMPYNVREDCFKIFLATFFCNTGHRVYLLEKWSIFILKLLVPELTWLNCSNSQLLWQLILSLFINTKFIFNLNLS